MFPLKEVTLCNSTVGVVTMDRKNWEHRKNCDDVERRARRRQNIVVTQRVREKLVLLWLSETF